MNFYKIFSNKKFSLKILFLPLFFYLPFQIYTSQALEFQWDTADNYKKLKWYQSNPKKNGKNKIFFFFRPSDRKTGLLSINIKVPENFQSNLKPKNISFCKVKIGGFDSRTKCVENIPSDIEINREDKKVEVYPISPVPSNKESYAIVFKLNNPKRSGLYQFHSFGKSSGPVPLGSYIGSWTIRIDHQ